MTHPSGHAPLFTVLGEPGSGTCVEDVCTIPTDHDEESPVHSIATIEYEKMDGTRETLGDHAGEVVLVVNVASKCGLAPQYAGLQQLYATHHERGLTVLGFPANDFMGQEPGTDAEILDFCSMRYDVTFPVMSKISVAGPTTHPLYRALTEAVPIAEGKDTMRTTLRDNGNAPTEDPEVLWNFEKFLIGRDCRVVARFCPTTAPDDPALVAAVEAELAKQP